jgi:hypothetical protein
MKNLIALISLCFYSFCLNAQINPLSGQCGLLLSGNFAGFDIAQKNQSGQIANSLLLINFDSKTIFSSDAILSNFGMANATSVQTNSINNFTLTSDYIPGSYKLTFSGTSAFMTLLPVYSGNTFLVQLPGNGTSMSPKTGICQKV